jgi:DNA repair exonuclease SbcCD nuclease subunit
VPVVVLPGNHDPLTPGSVYRRIERPPNVYVLGLDGPELWLDASWTIAGRAHLDYGDFQPLGTPDDNADAASREHRIVLAHGHYDLAGEASARHRPGWLITDGDLDRLAARYVGLGHWDRAFEVRPAGPPTYYSGSPWLAGSVNVVDLASDGRVAVERTALREVTRTR